MQSQVHDRVVGILADLFQLDIAPAGDDIQRDSVAEWDSVSHLHLVLELEEVFGVALTDHEVVGIASARDITTLLERRGVVTAPSAA